MNSFVTNLKIVGIACAIVTVVVAVASVILFPIFAGSQRQPRRNLDIVNAKMVALAFIMYSSDFEDRLPSASHWEDQLLVRPDYIQGNYRIVISDSPPRRIAMNVFLSEKNMARVREPENTVLDFTCNAAHKNAYGGFELLNVPPKGTNATVALVDGHVQAKPRREMAKKIWVPAFIHQTTDTLQKP